MTADNHATAWKGGLAVFILLVATSCGTGLLAPSIEPVGPADADAIESTIFLIGDAGNPAPEEPVLIALKRQVTESPGDRVVVFLGDNVYPRGMPVEGAPDRSEAERRLLDQIEVGTADQGDDLFRCRAITTGPTWARPDGTESSGRAISSRPGAVAWLSCFPVTAAPAPRSWMWAGGSRIILLDTQWWVHEFSKPTDSTSKCADLDRKTGRRFDARRAQVAARRDSAKQALPDVGLVLHVLEQHVVRRQHRRREAGARVLRRGPDGETEVLTRLRR